MAPNPVFSWRANYILKIGMKEEQYSINIDDPTENEIITSQYFKGARENTRRYLVQLKADSEMDKHCDFLAFKTKSAPSYKLIGLDSMRDGKREFTDKQTPLGTGVGPIPSGPILSTEDYLKLEEKLSASDDLYKLYNLYNNSLKSNDIFEKYNLLYLMASRKANNEEELRTIRDMLHHIDLTVGNLFPVADRMFGKDVRSIDRNNPDHKKVVQDHLATLRSLAESTIVDLEKKKGV